MVIKTVEEIVDLKRTILENAETAYERLRSMSKELSAISFLTEVKFDKIGIDPLKGTELNFVEQLNQMFSDLVVLEGAKRLLNLYPDKVFMLNLGSASGFDIESVDGEIAAECFAVTTATSNRKLVQDSVKLTQKAAEKQKYIYFYSQNDLTEKIQRICNKYPEIKFTRLFDFGL